MGRHAYSGIIWIDANFSYFNLLLLESSTIAWSFFLYLELGFSAVFAIVVVFFLSCISLRCDSFEWNFICITRISFLHEKWSRSCNLFIKLFVEIFGFSNSKFVSQLASDRFLESSLSFYLFYTRNLDFRLFIVRQFQNLTDFNSSFIQWISSAASYFDLFDHSIELTYLNFDQNEARNDINCSIFDYVEILIRFDRMQPNKRNNFDIQDYSDFGSIKHSNGKFDLHFVISAEFYHMK